MKSNFDFEYTKDLILAKFPLLGVHLAGIKFKEITSCPTMATDGYVIYYSSKFLNSISEEEKCFCLTHEVMHIAFDHIVRLENKNPLIWNIATDAVINQMLQAEGWKIPEGAVNIPEAKDKSAIEMYHILKEKFDQEQEKFKELQDQYNKNNQNIQNEQPKNGQPTQSQPTEGSQNNDQNQQNDNGQGQNQQGNPQQNSNGQGNDQNSQPQENGSLNQPNNHNQNQQETQNQQNEQGDKESLKQQSSSSDQNHQSGEPNGKMDNPNLNNSQNQQNNSISQNGTGDQKEMPQNQQNQKNAGNPEVNESKLEKPSSYFDQFEGKNTHDHWEKSLKKHIEEREEKKSEQKKGNTQATSLSDSDKKGDSSKIDNEETENTFSKNEKQEASKNATQNIDQDEDSSQKETQLNNNHNPEVGSAAEGADEKCSENEKSFLKQNKNIREERAQEIINRLNERKKAYQKQCLAAQETRYEIGEGVEVCNWKRILKKALLDEETRWSYRRSNRGNDYMARAEELEDETKSETEVLMDVSGSVTEPMLRGFLHQLRPLLKHTTFKVGCFDSEFYGFTEIKKSSDIDTFRIVSSKDWENFDNAVRQFSKKPEVNKIIFTDGGNPPGHMPEEDLKKMNVIWIVFYNRNFRPCCGKVIHVELDELLRKRMNLMGMQSNSSRQRD